MTGYVIPASVTSVTADSRQVVAGSLFLAYPGPHHDGRQYIPQAIANGAATVWWESQGFEWDQTWPVTQQPVLDLGKQAGAIASQFYQTPSTQMWCIGVTGTNGKTTVTHWLAQAYGYLQHKAAVIGTLGNGLPQALQATANTTPGPIDLQRLLAGFVAQAVEVVAMEVSSHGLDQGRVNGMAFDVAVFTNLTRDHLDYHQTMEAYQDAKRKLFDWPGLSAMVINADDAFGVQLLQSATAVNCNVLSYGVQHGDVRATQIRVQASGFEVAVITPQGEGVMHVHAAGQFNVYNALAVLSCLLVHGVALADAIEAIGALVPVPGRMQMFGGGALPLVVVDYAHTPDALEKALHSLRAQTQGQLWCVFGCGGDRDSGKRAEMGRIASQLADQLVLTTDNPRSENPAAIMAAIVEGVVGTCRTEVDRASAIAQVISNAAAGDVVLVAGKGHEAYQEIAGVRHPYSDADSVREALQRAATTA